MYVCQHVVQKISFFCSTSMITSGVVSFFFGKSTFGKSTFGKSTFGKSIY